MKKTKSLKRITNLIAVTVILLGVIPFTAAANITTVYADDGNETTEPAETAAEETPVEEASPAPEVEEAAPAEDAETEGDEAVSTEAAETEGKAAEEVDADAAEETEDVLEEAVVAEAEEEILPEASETTVEETVETEVAVDVSEIVEVLSEAEVQIVDENGEALPLASIEAVEVLVKRDPFFWSVAENMWVGYTESGTGCPINVDCRPSLKPFQAAVNQAGFGNTIYVAGGTYNEDVVLEKTGTVDATNLSFTAFNSITVPDAHNPTLPTYTSGYAVVDKITLNVDFGTTLGVYAKEVIVNGAGTADGWLDDGMALVNDGGTIEADMIIYYNDVDNDPQNPDSSNYPSGQLRVKDAHHASVSFEWECGEPNEVIYPGENNIYRMILKDPSHLNILDYYTTHGDERIDAEGYNNSTNHEGSPYDKYDYKGPYLNLDADARMEDLLIGVNLSEVEEGWTSELDEKRIYWYLIGNTGYDNNYEVITLTHSQQLVANRITDGAFNDIDKTHSIWFLWPEARNGEKVSPDNIQLTFFGYKTRVVSGCTDREAENYDPNATDDNGLCAYPAPVPPPTTTTTTTTTTVAALAAPILGIIPVTGQFPLITAGIGHTCALTAKEGLECWGLNESGQVGDSTFEDKLVPVDVVGIDPSAVIGLVSGIHHTCVLTSANEVFCWGLNSSGQLGDGTTENSNVPLYVEGLEGRIISISAGAEFTCALNDTDEVFCWGNNSSGQLNDGTEENSSIPMKSTTVSDPVQISGGSAELQGITSDGVVQLWNSQPIIPVTGLPNEDNAYVSADRFTDGGCSMTDTGDVNCWGGITDAQVKGALVSDMLASGEGHACTMKAEGLVCWGSNSNGQLGDDSLNDTVEEVLVTELEQGVIALAAGMKHTCVIYEDETVVCWGLNDYGQLGNDTIDDSMVPVETK